MSDKIEITDNMSSGRKEFVEELNKKIERLETMRVHSEITPNMEVLDDFGRLDLLLEVPASVLENATYISDKVNEVVGTGYTTPFGVLVEQLEQFSEKDPTDEITKRMKEVLIHRGRKEKERELEQDNPLFTTNR